MQEKICQMELSNEWMREFIQSFNQMAIDLNADFGTGRFQFEGKSLKRKTKECWRFMKELTAEFIKSARAWYSLRSYLYNSKNTLREDLLHFAHHESVVRLLHSELFGPEPDSEGHVERIVLDYLIEFAIAGYSEDCQGEARRHAVLLLFDGFHLVEQLFKGNGADRELVEPLGKLKVQVRIFEKFLENRLVVVFSCGVVLEPLPWARGGAFPLEGVLFFEDRVETDLLDFYPGIGALKALTDNFLREDLEVAGNSPTGGNEQNVAVVLGVDFVVAALKHLLRCFNLIYDCLQIDIGDFLWPLGVGDDVDFKNVFMGGVNEEPDLAGRVHMHQELQIFMQIRRIQPKPDVLFMYLCLKAHFLCDVLLRQQFKPNFSKCVRSDCHMEIS